MTATSSAVAERTAPPSVSAADAAALGLTWPKAPKSTFAIDRFIARLIRIVSNVPEAPTSMPLTINTLFSSSKPVAAAAMPVKAFSSEITTGMSAPAVGSPNVKLAERDQGRRAAADAVEQRHHLRYCRHLHAPRRNGSEAPADGHTDDDLPVADHRLLREGDRDRDQHPNRADPVSAPRSRGVGEELQRQDEGDDRRQVGKVSRYLAQRHLIGSEEPPACSGPPSRLRRRGPSALLRAARAF